MQYVQKYLLEVVTKCLDQRWFSSNNSATLSQITMWRPNLSISIAMVNMRRHNEHNVYWIDCKCDSINQLKLSLIIPFRKINLSTISTINRCQFSVPCPTSNSYHMLKTLWCNDAASSMYSTILVAHYYDGLNATVGASFISVCWKYVLCSFWYLIYSVWLKSSHQSAANSFLWNIY